VRMSEFQKETEKTTRIKSRNDTAKDCCCCLGATTAVVGTAIVGAMVMNDRQ
jgi:hypothetical protein